MEKELWQILIDNRLDKYISILEENNIDKEIFIELTESDYVKLGITGDAMHKMMKLFSPNYAKLVEKSKIENLPKVSKNTVKAVEEKQISETISRVHKILIDNNLSEYIPVFDKHKIIDFDILSKLTENDLSELGVSAIGDRKKIKELFKIKSEKPEDKNSVVVTQTVTSEGTNTGGIVVSILVGAVLICIVLYYAIPRFIL